MSSGLRLGLFGGSFDPVHVGHLHAARAARDARGLDRVLFVPARQSPHKLGRQLAGGADRVRLLERALAAEDDFAVDPRELAREGPSYTIDTVEELLAEHAGARLTLIIGSDNLPGLPSWRRVHDLLRLTDPLVVHRTDDPDALLGGIAESLDARELAALSAGFLRLPPVRCSSTGLRERLARGESVAEDLPPGVEALIRELKLYGEGS